MDASRFETRLDEKEIHLFHIYNQNIACYITNYGARVVSLSVMDAASRMTDVVLGFNSIQEYIDASEQYHGATIGRFANRIGGGTFMINKVVYNVDANNDGNTLHGGLKAFHNSVWKCLSYEVEKVVFQLVSPSMVDGFPGELLTKVTYSVVGSNLRIEYNSKTSENTVVNFTHHSYFNLNGEDSGSILSHELRLNAEFYTPITEEFLPTGSIEMVSDTPFDFTNSKKIGRDINTADDQLKIANGYDHNFVVNQYEKGKLNFIGKAVGDQSQIKMEVWSTEPGVQFYTANHFIGLDKGKSQTDYDKNHAFCLETQHFPNSPNQANFPSTLLLANEIFQSKTEYRFSI